MEIKFYRCPVCGNLITKLVDSGVTPVCCGQEMVRLEARTTDLAAEKHVPAVEKTGDGKLLVKVGSVAHPMLPDHHIVFICLETSDGIQVRFLEGLDEAVAEFRFTGEPVAVYEFCNLHGLWKAPAR